VTQTFLDETFDDGILNPEPWTFTYDVNETNGYLFLNQSTTDRRSSAKYTFEEPVYDATITFDTYNHDSNNRHMATTQLGFTAQDGTEFQVSFAMLKNPYIGGLDGNSNNYDLPRIKIEDANSATDWYFSSGANTSTFLDDWSAVTISIDSDVGMLFVDVESDGVFDFEIQDDRLIEAELGSLYFNSYGWFTGHYVYIDNLTVTGNTSLEPETPESTGFSMPIGDRNGLVVTEARETEDGWLDGWYNASDFDNPHPTVAGADHLGEDWNLDDLNGNGADEDDTGQAVYAVSVGRVVYVGEYYGASGPDAGFGQAIVIEHLLPDGQTVYSLYAHLEDNSVTVVEGQIISEDDFQIGAVGKTGFALGPHLHFELFGVDGATGSLEDEPWLLAMNEFAYVSSDIASDTSFHTEDYADGSVTWYDPSDFIQGGVGFDVDEPVEVSGSNGGGVVSGGSGNDDLSGGNGGDVIFGNDGADVISGGNGGDRVLGGAGSDYLSGGNGNDELFGGEGADQIDGGKGTDTLDGGTGNDILIGGKGDDEFVFNLTDAPSGHDAIFDLSKGDTVTITGGPASFENLGFEQQLDGVLVHLGDGSSVLLSGIEASDVGADLFNFI
jgi:Ca2+-binding RTX toxin-like protein